MRASRLLSLLMLLQMRGRMTARALADELEVSVRTIHRDVEALGAAGVPVFAERGREGGFRLLGGFRTRLTGLTGAEAEALPLAGLGAIAADLGLDRVLAAAQLKLMASLPADAAARVGRIAERFYLDPTAWYRRPELPPALRDVAHAVWSQRRLQLEYASWNGVVRRTLDPLGLVFKDGAWYVVAAVDEQIRTYRVASIRQLKILETTFARPRQFDLRRHWQAWARDFERRLFKERARVRLSARGLKLLSEVSEAAAAAASEAGTGDSGWIEAEIPIESVERATWQLLHLGAEVEVLTPVALRRRLATEAGRVQALYRSRSVRPRRAG